MSTSLLSALRQGATCCLVLLGWLSNASAWAQVDNYQFAPSQGTFTPVSAAAIAVPDIQVDDDVSGTLPIGFSFVFDGTPYTSFVASSNGILSFNTGATANRFNDLSTGAAATERPFIAPLWTDLDGRIPGAMASYELTGASPNRTLTMEWRNWAVYSFPAATASSISFQVKLHETTNRVELVYRQEAGPLGTLAASIGLAGVGTGSGSFLSLSDASASPSTSSVTSTDNISQAPATGQVYAFTPAPLAACPTPRNVSATAITSTAATLNWTVASGGGTFTVVYGPTGFNPAHGGHYFG